MESAQTPGLRLDLIIRTSQRKQDAQSPAQQRQQAEGICLAGGHQIVAVHDSGHSESGKTMDRQSVRAFQERRRAGLTDGVVVGYLDRLGRAPIEESMTFMRELVGDGGVLIAADWNADPIDLTDPNTEDMLVFRMQMNRSQWSKAAQRYKLSQRNAIAAGKWIGKAPLGFVKITSGDEKGGLAKHPERWLVVRDCYRIVGRDGPRAGVQFMERMVPERDWDASRLRRVLGSRVYRGEVHFKGFAPNLDAHPALVTESEWLAAQTDAHERRANGDYPLSHLIHCECGADLVGGLQTVRKHGYSYRRMRCAACNRCSIRAETLEAYVRAVLENALGDQGFRDEFGVEGLQAAEDALEAAKSERTALTRKIKFSDPDFAAWKAQADADVAAAQADYQRLAVLANESETLPFAHELDDPEAFLRGLRAVAGKGRFVVAYASRGARVAVEDRVSYVLHGRDDVTWAAAA